MGKQLEESNEEKKHRIDGHTEKRPIDEQISDAGVAAEESGQKRSVKWSRGKLICTGAATAVGVLLLAGGLTLICIKMVHKFQIIERRECISSCDSCLNQCGSLHNRSLARYFNCSERCRALHSERCNEHCTNLAGEHLENFSWQVGNESLLRPPPVNSTQTGRVNPALCTAASNACADAFSICRENCRDEKWYSKPDCVLNCSLAIIQCVAVLVGYVAS